MSILIKRLLLIFVLCLVPFSSLAFGQGIGFMAEEADGSPSAYAYKMIVPNNSLSVTSSVATLSIAPDSGFTTGLTMGSLTADDVTPDVTGGATGIAANRHYWQTANTVATTITDFNDGDDHS